MDIDTERRIQQLCDAVDLLAPLLKDAVDTLKSDVPAQAAALEAGRRAVVRARNAFLADTQPIVLVSAAAINDRGYHGDAMHPDPDPKTKAEDELDDEDLDEIADEFSNELDDEELDDLADELLDEDDDDDDDDDED